MILKLCKGICLKYNET